MIDQRERLAALARERGASLAALSRMIGRNSSYLQQYITKGSPKKLEEGDRQSLARYFGVSDADLGGVEENSYGLAGDWTAVPRLSLSASAGRGAHGAEERCYDSFCFSRRWLREQGLSANMLSAIRVLGDSMHPLLHDGDEILVDRTPRHFREGVHVVRIGDNLHVKRVQLAKPGHVRLISENPAYEAMDFSTDDVAIIGRVVWKAGRL